MRLSDLSRELRLAARALARKPTFSLVVVGTLALALGATTIIYSIVHGVLLRPLPYADAGRLVDVWQVGARGGQGQFSDPNFEDLRDGSRAFSGLAQYATGTTTVVAGGVPLRAGIARVSRQFFEVMGTPPQRGRTFQPGELAVGAPLVALVSDGFWRGAMSAGPLDQPVRVGGDAVTVVGVMPPEFDFPSGTEVWMPREQQQRNPHRTAHNWRVVGRIDGSVPLATARAEARAVAKGLASSLGAETAMADVALVPLQEQMTGSSRQPLLILLGAVGCLVTIACANLANLLLAHVSGRRRELAVRSALGAGRAALALPLVAETTLLTLAGGVLGTALGAAGLRIVLSVLPLSLPRRADIAVSWPVLLAVLGVAAVTGGVLAGAAAWHAMRADAADWLKQGQRGQTGSWSAGRLRNGLVVMQLAVSLILLVGAGLLGRSLSMLLAQAPGFRTEQVLTIELAPGGGPEAGPRRVRLYEQLLERLAALPGVESAGGVNRFPLAAGGANGTYVKGVSDIPPDSIEPLRPLFRDPARSGQAEFRVASAGYFRALGIPLENGRLFDARDAPTSPHVAVVSASMAASAWPGQDPIGQRVQFGNIDGDLRVFTVIGVVGDIRERGLDSQPRPTFYADYRQRPRLTSNFTLALQTASDAARVIAPARAVLQELAPDVAPRFRTVDQVFALSVADRRFNLYVLGAFASAALLLAVLGIYGVLAYVVAQRMQEFGVRIALGATRRNIWGLVLRRASALVLAGVTIGTAASWGLTRLMSSLLFGVTATDPVTYAVVVAALSAVALLGCQVPAVRATRVDPLTALRAE